MKSRLKFVKQVANTIRRNHGQDRDSSFIFGISGKWGEGKTQFLQDLKDELQSENKYRVVHINPWKYGDDKQSLLRNFLLSIRSHSQLPAFESQDFLVRSLRSLWQPPKKKIGRKKKRDYVQRYENLQLWWKQLSEVVKNDWQVNLHAFRRFLNNRHLREELYADTSKTSIHWGLALLYFLILVNILLWHYILSNGPLQFSNFFTRTLLGNLETYYTSNKLVLDIALVTGVLSSVYALAQSMLTTQVVNKYIRTVDQFDDVLTHLLAEEKRKKIVVFVDDLDRVTPEFSRNVLDTLRVFFNRPEISFVVTGDHTVLERYIGELIVPESKPNEKLEEGKRYLKKIFNVYWRLPLPIKSEFRQALETILQRKMRKAEILLIFSKSEYELFMSFLENYFDRNFRAIERFVEKVLFTFEIIEIQLEDASEETWGKHIQELKTFPLLVTRVLLIEEFCAPLFEKIARKISILDDLELAAHKKDLAMVNDVIAREEVDLTPIQEEILKRILFDSDGFYDQHGNCLVQDYHPFIHYAADASFGDARGPLPDQFLVALEVADKQRISNLLVGGEEKLQQAAKQAVSLLNKKEDVTVHTQIASALIAALRSKTKDHNSHAIFSTALLHLHLEPIFQNQTIEERVTYYLDFFRWLDNVSPAVTTEWRTKFPFQDFEDFTYVQVATGMSKLGHFSSRMMGNWFGKAYALDKSRGLDSIARFLPLLDAASFAEEFRALEQQFIDDFMSPQSNHLRDIMAELVNRFGSDNAKQILRNFLFNNIDTQQEALSLWTVNAIKQHLIGFIQIEEVEQRIIDQLPGAETEESLIKLLEFARNKITYKKQLFWNTIWAEKADLFICTLPFISADENFRPFAPHKEVADALFMKLLQKVQDSSDVLEKMNWLNFLNKKKWMWDAVNILPSQIAGTGLTRSKNVEAKEKIKDVRQSWT